MFRKNDDTEKKLKIVRAFWNNTDDDTKINASQKYCRAEVKANYARVDFKTNNDLDETLNDFA